MTDHVVTRAIAAYAPGLADTLAAMDIDRVARQEHHRRNWGSRAPAYPHPMPPPPVVTLDEEQRAHMASVDVRALQRPCVEELFVTSWDELYLAWAVHSHVYFGATWKQLDGSNLMYCHVGSGLHILRLQVIAAQEHIAAAA